MSEFRRLFVWSEVQLEFRSLKGFTDSSNAKRLKGKLLCLNLASLKSLMLDWNWDLLNVVLSRNTSNLQMWILLPV